MRKFLGQHRKIVYGFGLILIIVGLWLGGGLLGFELSVFPLQRLEAARATWNRKGSDSYRMMLWVFRPLSTLCSTVITVKRGQIDHVDGNSCNVPLLDPTDPSTSQFTMDGLFDYAASKLAQQPPIRLSFCPTDVYRVEFDPDLGYVRRVIRDTCGGGGLLCPVISDCTSMARVSDLQLMPR
jgi:Family of unknown function (DUF6174)